MQSIGLSDVRGVAVDKVMENSPAATAGLQAGDVITRINGADVTGTRKLTRLIGEIDPDHQAAITVMRNGREMQFTATLAKRTMPAFENGNFDVRTPMGKLELGELKGLDKLKELQELKELPPGASSRVFTVPGGEGKVFTWRSGGRQIGIGITPLTKQLAQHFGVESGVMISSVREDSPASHAGLMAGDIIVEADGKALKGDLDLIKAINEKKEGDVRLTFVRDGNRQTVSVTPEEGKDGNMFFQTDGEDGMTPPIAPAAPGQFKMARPITPSAPATFAPLTTVRRGRVI